MTQQEVIVRLVAAYQCWPAAAWRDFSVRRRLNASHAVMPKGPLALVRREHQLLVRQRKLATEAGDAHPPPTPQAPRRASARKRPASAAPRAAWKASKRAKRTPFTALRAGHTHKKGRY